MVAHVSRETFLELAELGAVLMLGSGGGTRTPDTRIMIPDQKSMTSTIAIENRGRT
jgi:hypothetical protein